MRPEFGGPQIIIYICLQDAAPRNARERGQTADHPPAHHRIAGRISDESQDAYAIDPEEGSRLAGSDKKRVVAHRLELIVPNKGSRASD